MRRATVVILCSRNTLKALPADGVVLFCANLSGLAKRSGAELNH